MAEYSNQEISRIEEKWRQRGDERGTFKTAEDPAKPKYYVLDMFPYPSGAGLHVGHPLGYIASDIIARYKRITGFNVLHPMGFDAFGLPAEQYAIQTGQHPAVTTARNIETYKKQLRLIGFSFDWSREVQTSSPDFYKWTQWIFLQLFDSWYNKNTDRTERIETLTIQFNQQGNEGVNAACDDDTPRFTATKWKAFNPLQRENILQKYRIAYQSEAMVNWCPGLGTVLSNDEVKDGVSERGGYPVERIKMLQWSMRISAYADRLLTGLDTIDWPEPMKEIQRNWIGKSVGCELDFKIAGTDNETIRVFTTRIDTIFGVTFMVLAPEHEVVDRITTNEQRKEVTNYVAIARNRSERERLSEVKRISGVFTGAFAVNPVSEEKIPVWISDYVLAGYGTGAVMAVPSSDTRDYAFANHFNLPVIAVLEGPASDITRDNFDPKSGVMINSDFLNGLPWNEAIEKALQKVETLGVGVRKVNYRMRDAIFGRQRYWGEPFPIYFRDGIPLPVHENELPVTLPEIDAYKPTETGEPPLARAKEWKYHGSYPYELTTMPGWAGSSWYWYRYMDPKNDIAFCSKEKESYWKDVDLYIGGAEHATGHLLYSRFWNKALKDLGYVDAEEPFRKLINQGHIQGVSQKIYFSGRHAANTFPTPDGPINLGERVVVAYYSRNYWQNMDAEIPGWITESHVSIEMVDEHGQLDLVKFSLNQDKDSIFFCENGYYLDSNFHQFTNGSGPMKFLTTPVVEKMSKSKYNVINPDDIINRYGADTLRMYEMFLGPLEQSKPWSTNGIDGVYKFLRRFWNLFHDSTGTFRITDADPDKVELKALHRTIKKVAADMNNFSFNTSVSEFMICVNELSSAKCNKRKILEPLVITLSPFAPFISEEIWEKLGHPKSISGAEFPGYDEKYLKENSFDYPISVNGKVRATMNFALDMPKEDLERHVLASEIVQKWSEGKPPKKVIVVPGKIVNVVL